jgi:predicted nuclease with TOPRIM domain
MSNPVKDLLKEYFREHRSYVEELKQEIGRLTAENLKLKEDQKLIQDSCEDSVLMIQLEEIEQRSLARAHARAEIERKIAGFNDRSPSSFFSGSPTHSPKRSRGIKSST